AGGPARGLWAAKPSQAAQPKRSSVVVLGDRGGSGRGLQCAVRLPQPNAPGAAGGRRPGMNLFVADPEWGWWIVLYFYLGGIAAGAYFTATLIDLVGGEADRKLARAGYLLVFPLVLLCGLFLTVDLERPERFWHMLFRSEVVHEALEEHWPVGGWSFMLQAPLLKRWSPMSVGSWALTVFGACSGLSFLGSLWSEGR